MFFYWGLIVIHKKIRENVNFSSPNFESFPTAIIQALACGLPAINTACYIGPREMLSNVNNFKRIIDKIELADYEIRISVNNQNYFIKAINLIIITIK